MMWWTNIIIVSLVMQSLLIPNIDGNAYRRHRRRRQTSGSLYGTNANLGASAPAGYNHPASYSIQGTRLNNADARDLYGNPMIPSSNPDNSLNSVNYYNQQRQQQQQLYGTNDQSLLNNLYNGNSFYSGSGANGNLLPPGLGGSSFYSSSNTQMAYPAIPNQVLATKDLYGTSSNTNNNPYGYNNNQLPNSNTYGGPMGSNNNLSPNSNSYGPSMGSNNNLLPNSNSYGGQMGGNNNLLPNSNTYGGSMGSNTNLVPNSNTYSGYMGTTDNKNVWANPNPNNNNYRYGQNSANSWYPNRDTNNNNNINNRYSNPNSYPYNHSYHLTTSVFIIFLSIFATMVLHG